MNIELVLKNAMQRHGVTKWEHYLKPDYRVIIGIRTVPQLIKEKAEKIENELNDDLPPLRFEIDNTVGEK
jgi:hypothetical protein